MKYFIIIGILVLFGLGIFWFIPTKDNKIPQNSIVTLNQEIKTDELVVSPISIKTLREKIIDSEVYKVEQKLEDGSNYERYLVSYLSEGEKVFGLLTVPFNSKPSGGFPAVIFNHGYIPPNTYSTINSYASYVDYLARNGFVVFKIDMRGHGNSQGLATGSYFSSTYTIDLLSALKSLQKSEIVDPKRVGVWGHSMSGNLVLRSMLVSEEIKAGVIWAGAVYSYDDFKKYRISDSSYMARTQMQTLSHPNRDTNPEIQRLRDNSENIDFSNSYWKSISLTQNIKFLKNPIQIHHAENDDVVNIGYSKDLEKVLIENDKSYEFYEYEGGGHNITGIYFETAMKRTVEFFNKYL